MSYIEGINKRISMELMGYSEEYEPLKYINDIDKAWLVVTKLREKGYSVTITDYEDFNPKSDYRVSAGIRSQSGYFEVGSHSEDICIAICLCALEVLDAEQEVKEELKING